MKDPGNRQEAAHNVTSHNVTSHNVTSHNVTSADLQQQTSEHRQRQEQRYTLLQSIIASVLSEGRVSPGTGFLERMVGTVATLLEIDLLLVARVSRSDPDLAETIVAWQHGGIIANFSYRLTGTPCAEIVQQRLCLHYHGVAARFPEDRMLAEIGAELYLGVPLLGTDGQPLGLLAAAAAVPVDDTELLETVMQLVAAHATMELVRVELTSERARAEGALRETQSQLEELYETMAQGVVYLDQQGRIVELNVPAEQVLGGTREQLLGCRIDDARWRVVCEDGAAVTAEDHPLLRTLRSGQPVRNLLIGLADATASGAVCWVLVNVSRCQPRASAPAAVVALTLSDLTELRLAGHALRASEEKFRSIVESSPMGMHRYRLHPDGRLVFTGANPAANQILGFDSSSLVGLTIEDAFPSLVETEVPDRYREVCRTGGTWIAEQIDYADERLRGAFEVHAFRTGPRSMAVLFLEISERKRAEQLATIQRDLALGLASVTSLDEALPQCLQTALLVSSFDAGGVYLVDQEGGTLHLAHSRGLSEIYRSAVQIFAADSPHARRVMAGKPLYLSNEMLAPPVTEAERIEGLLSLAILPVKYRGEVIACITLASHTSRDIPLAERPALEITAAQMGSSIVRLTASEALRRREEEYRLLVENQTDLVVKTDAGGRFLFVSPSYCRFFDTTEQALLGRPFLPLVHEEDQGATEQAMSAVLSPPHVAYFEQRARTREGWRWLAWSTVAVLDKDRQVTAIVGIARDITGRKSAELALEESERRYRNLVEASPVAIVVHSGGVVRYANPAACRLFDVDGDTDLVGSAALELVHPDDRADVAERIRMVLERGEAAPLAVERFLCQDGQIVYLEVAATRVRYEGIPAVQVVALDITRRFEIEQEKIELEAQLMQAQKMEAIGRLAGGVAHDFNNLLTAISGYSELTLSKLDPDSPLYSHITEILKAASRASGLTQQLLAFSRKQIIELRIIDLGDAVQQSQRMLSRIIGEDIELNFSCAPGLWPIKADQNQIDQILINLATNSRDAMPGGGTLTIELNNLAIDDRVAQYLNLAGGEYVMLAVSDTGCGIDREIQQHIFEPFFTTKELDKGTGLGLSTVYGIVKQHNGAITVSSEKGIGTTIRIYFCRAGVAHRQSAPALAASVTAPGGEETVLLVEDEEHVRGLVRGVLESRGYHVLEAADGVAAQALAEQHESIALLLTDVVMPRINGRQLYELLHRQRPDLKVLYMSGYAEDVIAHHGALEEGAQLLAKPFSTAVLLIKVRQVLDAAPAPGGPGAV